MTPPLWDLYQQGFAGVLTQRILSGDVEIVTKGFHPETVVNDVADPPKEQNPENQDIATEYVCDFDTLSNYLHDFEVPGMHVVCLHQNSLAFFKDAMLDRSPKTVAADQVKNWSDLKQILSSELGLRSEDELHQPWYTFSPTGHRLFSENDDGNASIDKFSRLGLFLVMQGGQWIWPGIHKGYRREILLDVTRNATLETISLHPLVLSVQGFLSEGECDWIQMAAAPQMRYSEVKLMDHDKGRPASDFRTSQTAFLASRAPEMKEIDSRTASLVRIPENHQESAQVLRYDHSEKYNTHHDYFEPSLYQKDPNTLRLIKNGRRNRMTTVFWYLSDVEVGGETVFPRFDKAPHPRSGQDFDSGLRVKPERGKVIIFYSMTPDGVLDPFSLHGAAPVKEGLKWAANKWVWNLPLR
jgi:prolyl 4-hydroxylase